MTRVSGLISIIMSVMGIFSVVMKYGELVVDRMLMMKSSVPMDVRTRQAILSEKFITKGRRISTLATHIEMDDMRGNPMKESNTVRWRKRRSDDGRVYYVDVTKGTSQWEKPEGADELLTDED